MSDSDERMDLAELDPGSGDPGFWIRFHGQIMAQTKDELARRRMAGEWSVAEVVFQWRKTLVPLTLLAATLAGIFLIGQEEPVAPRSAMVLEEALVEGLPGDPIPTFLGQVAELEEVEFLTAAGGF